MSSELCLRCLPYRQCLSVGMCIAEDPHWKETRADFHRAQIRDLEQRLDHHRKELTALTTKEKP